MDGHHSGNHDGYGNHHGGVAENVFPWICWQLWLSGNQLLFENRDISPAETILRSISSAREWITAQGTNAITTKVGLLPAEIDHPPIGNRQLTRSFTDAAWNKDTLTTGLWMDLLRSIRTDRKGLRVSGSLSALL
ncbi:uncharacterized protein LOC130505727 [Raphanus sativus]|uniref:Uncharacterized protein LOC130505727 n=1 Tax=Raphanus sativus TaxID=3726 RepID=A0A9W3CXJ3_RAPSA|nr:uncharacterized protein LOC130505727 [Raphanus sativus]